MAVGGYVEIRLPHRVEYKVKGAVPIREVIGTLQAHEELASQLGEFLESCIDGLAVQKIDVLVETVEHGSLVEQFFLSLLVTYQTDLKQSVPRWSRIFWV